jgi:Lrp/AsnC family transcriptional regulator, leucine-responsive regulatory protein
MKVHSMTTLDDMDWRILGVLQADARASFNEISRTVHLSAPAVADRVRRLEQAGVITGYHAQVDLTTAGWPVLALVRLRCYGPTCALRDPDLPGHPSVLEIHRVTGDECCVLKIAATSMDNLEQVINGLAEYGTPSSTLILSSPLRRSDVVPAK